MILALALQCKGQYLYNSFSTSTTERVLTFPHSLSTSTTVRVLVFPDSFSTLAFAHLCTLTPPTVQAQYRNLLVQAEVVELRTRVSSQNLLHPFASQDCTKTLHPPLPPPKRESSQNLPHQPFATHNCTTKYPENIP